MCRSRHEISVVFVFTGTFFKIQENQCSCDLSSRILDNWVEGNGSIYLVLSPSIDRQVGRKFVLIPLIKSSLSSLKMQVLSYVSC